MRTLIAFAILASFVASCERQDETPQPAPVIIRPGSWYKTPVEGKATVMTGDTFSVKGETVHLWGISAPEWCARGSKESQQHLEQLIEHQMVTCDRVNRMSGNTTVGRWCHTALIADVSKQMVADGYAVDWPKYSVNEYLEAQAEAVKAQRGLWAFLEPWNAEQARNSCPK
jgi:endonuclease YncB( thermonuclease family)